jgi:recombination protein RecA
VKVVKNKLAPPFREAEFDIMYGTGVNKLGELVDTAEKLGIVEKSGTWYSYEGAKLGQGREKVLAHLDDNPALAQQLREVLVRQAKLATAGAGAASGTNGVHGGAS